MANPDVQPPAQKSIQANGVLLSYFEWNGHLRDRKAPILFAHATGFHARIFDQTISHLGEQWILSLDLRGHGRSQNTPIEHWRVFGADVLDFVAALDLRDIIGVGHSMGGHAMVDAAAKSLDRFARLLLIDPVIVDPSEYEEGRTGMEGVEGQKHPTAKRRNHFASADEMFERFASRPPYVAFDRRVLRDYCEYGLVPRSDGDGLELGCPPDVEASIYMTSRSNGRVYESVREARLPVTLLRARLPPPDRDKMDFSSSPTWPRLATEFHDALDVHLVDHTHFIPMEAPELTARYVLSREGVGR